MPKARAVSASRASPSPAAAAKGSFGIMNQPAPRSKSAPTGRPGSTTLVAVLRVREADNLSRALTAVHTGDSAAFEAFKALNILLPFAYRTLHDEGRPMPEFNMLASLTNVVSQMLDPQGNLGIIRCLSEGLVADIEEEGPFAEEPKEDGAEGEEGEVEQAEGEPPGLRHAFSPTSTTSQCGNIVGKFVMNNSICWICGCTIGGPTSAPAGSRLQLTAECEHVLPVAQAIAFTGLYDSVLAKQLENTDATAPAGEQAAANALKPQYQAALGLEYGWAHVFCNQFKNNKHLIKDDAVTFRVASVDVVREWLDEMINWRRRGNTNGLYMKQFVTQKFRELAASAAIDATRDSVIRQAFPGIATPQQRLPPRGTPYSDDEVYAAWLAERAEIVFARNQFIMSQPAIAGMPVAHHRYQFYLNVLSFIEARFPRCYDLLNRIPTTRRGQDVQYDIVNNPIGIFVEWIRPKIAISVFGSINAVLSDIPSMYINPQTKATLLATIRNAEMVMEAAIRGITQEDYVTFLEKYATVINAKYVGAEAKSKFKGVQPMLIALMSLHRAFQLVDGDIRSVVGELPPRLQGSKDYVGLMWDKINASVDDMTKQVALNLFLYQEGDPDRPTVAGMFDQITASAPSRVLVTELQRGGRRRTYRRNDRRKTHRRRKLPKLL